MAGTSGGIRRQIEDGRSGFLVDSVEEAATRIVQLVQNSDLRERLVAAARKTVRERFLLPRMLEDHLDLLGDFETIYRLNE